MLLQFRSKHIIFLAVPPFRRCPSPGPRNSGSAHNQRTTWRADINFFSSLISFYSLATDLNEKEGLLVSLNLLVWVTFHSTQIATKKRYRKNNSWKQTSRVEIKVITSSFNFIPQCYLLIWYVPQTNFPVEWTT